MDNKIPSVIFKTREKDESLEGDNPFKWKGKTTDDYFKNNKEVN